MENASENSSKSQSFSESEAVLMESEIVSTSVSPIKSPERTSYKIISEEQKLKLTFTDSSAESTLLEETDSENSVGAKEKIDETSTIIIKDKRPKKIPLEKLQIHEKLLENVSDTISAKIITNSKFYTSKVSELIKSEVYYLEGLEKLQNYFLPILPHFSSLTEATKAKLYNLNVNQILDLHKEFLEDLKEMELGRTFDRFVERFFFYENYTVFYPDLAKELAQAREIDPQLMEFCAGVYFNYSDKWNFKDLLNKLNNPKNSDNLRKSLHTVFRHKTNKTPVKEVELPLGFHTIKQKQGKKKERLMDLNSYMIMPIQRLPKYELILRDLVKSSETPPQYSERLSLVLRNVQKVTNYLNEAKMQYEELQKVQNLTGNIVTGEGLKLPKIFHQGQMFYSGGSGKIYLGLSFVDLNALDSPSKTIKRGSAEEKETSITNGKGKYSEEIRRSLNTVKPRESKSFITSTIRNIFGSPSKNYKTLTPGMGGKIKKFIKRNYSYLLFSDIFLFLKKNTFKVKGFISLYNLDIKPDTVSDEDFAKVFPFIETEYSSSKSIPSSEEANETFELEESFSLKFPSFSKRSRSITSRSNEPSVSMSAESTKTDLTFCGKDNFVTIMAPSNASRRSFSAKFLVLQFESKKKQTEWFELIEKVINDLKIKLADGRRKFGVQKPTFEK